MEYGYLHANPARGVKFPQKGLKEKPSIIVGEDLARLLKQLNEPYRIRHIHSSLLNDLKVPVKIAQEQLGHASISTTLNIYTHVVDASHRSAVEAVEDRLFVDLVSNGLESANALEQAVPVSDSVN